MCWRSSFPMMMPLYLTTDDIGGAAWFSLPEWMTLWAIMNTITIGTNVVWGRLGDRFGWMRQMRWYGFGGMAVAALAFAYVPAWFGPSFPLMVVAAVIFALSVTTFFIHPPQPGITTETGRLLPRTERLAATV